jgi:hypothetical protein
MGVPPDFVIGHFMILPHPLKFHTGLFAKGLSRRPRRGVTAKFYREILSRSGLQVKTDLPQRVPGRETVGAYYSRLFVSHQDG